MTHWQFWSATLIWPVCVAFLLRSCRGLDDARKAEEAIIRACDSVGFAPKCEVIGDYPGCKGDLTVEGIFGKKPEAGDVAAAAAAASWSNKKKKKKKSTDGSSKKHKAAKTEEQLKQVASTLFSSFLDANPMMAAARHRRDNSSSSSSSSEEE